ncbi:MAG TPA: PDZ domain-containing protein, partial [Pirellulales bacterium]|nr:PDZ domain-containing protein [Pirellulales bacterium]
MLRKSPSLVLLMTVLGLGSAQLAAAQDQTDSRPPPGTETIPQTKPADNAGPSAPVPQTNILGMTLKEAKMGLVIVSRVSPNTPAAAAGVEVGDVIVALGGHPASPLKDLMPFAIKLVTTDKPGSGIAIEINRQGKTGVLTVPPSKEFSNSSANAQAVTQPGQSAAIIGLALRDISPSTVSVVNVMPGSPADVAGIKPADVISAMDRQAVSTSQELMNVVNAHRIGDTIEVQVVRQGKPFLTQMTIVPRLVDLAGVSAQQALSATNQEVVTLQQEITALRQQV